MKTCKDCIHSDDDPCFGDSDHYAWTTTAQGTASPVCARFEAAEDCCDAEAAEAAEAEMLCPRCQHYVCICITDADYNPVPCQGCGSLTCNGDCIRNEPSACVHCDALSCRCPETTGNYQTCKVRDSFCNVCGMHDDCVPF